MWARITHRKFLHGMIKLSEWFRNWLELDRKLRKKLQCVFMDGHVAAVTIFNEKKCIYSKYKKHLFIGRTRKFSTTIPCRDDDLPRTCQSPNVKMRTFSLSLP